jgi:extradiol dioxygenase family protein
VRNGGRWRLTDGQRFGVVLTVIIAGFLLAMSVGMQNLVLVIVALLLLVLAGLAVLLLRVRGQGPTRGNAHVITASPPPSGSIVGRCDLRLLVDFPSGESRTIKFRDPSVPVVKWPRVGMILPVEISIDNPRQQLRVLWDRVDPSTSRTVVPSQRGAEATPQIFTEYAADAQREYRPGPVYGGLDGGSDLDEYPEFPEEYPVRSAPSNRPDPRDSLDPRDLVDPDDEPDGLGPDTGGHGAGGRPGDPDDGDPRRPGATYPDALYHPGDPYGPGDAYHQGGTYHHDDEVDIDYSEYGDSAYREPDRRGPNHREIEYHSPDDRGTQLRSAPQQSAEPGDLSTGVLVDGGRFVAGEWFLDEDDADAIDEFDWDTRPDPPSHLGRDPLPATPPPMTPPPAPPRPATRRPGTGRPSTARPTPPPGLAPPRPSAIDNSASDPAADNTLPVRNIPHPRGTPRPADTTDAPAMGVMLIVSDLATSLSFYGELLSAQIADTTPTSAVLSYGGSRILLRQVADMSPVDRRVVHLHIQVPDVEVAYQNLRRKGVEFVHRPRVMNRGDKLELWAATFRDPDGHAIALTQWRSREEPPTSHA